MQFYIKINENIRNLKRKRNLNHNALNKMREIIRKKKVHLRLKKQIYIKHKMRNLPRLFGRMLQK